jgi:hypothetical protein
MDPGDIAARDVFHGKGGASLVPPADAPFTQIGVDNSGYSAGYVVTDGLGRTWDVKIGKEAQPEVVSSRVLWAIGYHQPVVHFVADWRIAKRTDPPPTGRFRLQSDHKNDGDWSWTDNPFVGTRELKGLIVANLVLNNWDLKASQNRVYRVQDEGTPGRLYVIQDLGASLGRTSWPTGNRNDVDGFESQQLIEEVENGVVKFDYHARHRELLEDITPADIVWVCGLLDQITDRQWSDIFRAATVDPSVSDRYRTALKSKIREGLALRSSTKARP